MTTFPGSPRFVKGAIVGLDKTNPLASVIVFQYNPEGLTRRLEARTKPKSKRATDKSEALVLTGPPQETITLSVEIDATDQLEQVDPLAVGFGIYPTLSALEMLLYPKSDTVIKDATQQGTGILKIIAPQAPLALFIWGPQRVLPVRLTDFTITEEAHDTLLNPIRAKVDLSLEVLSYADFKIGSPGYNLFLVHQIAKEVMATTNVFNSIQNTGTSLKLF
jgi:hypothetical protein